VTAPPVPKAARLATPSWLNTRVVLGLLLVLLSIVLGARLFASADDAQSVWVATRDLGPGTTIAEGDLEQGRVRLFDNGGRYLVASAPKPVGYVLTRGVGADEFLPALGLRSPEELARPLRDVSVPVEAGHLPGDLQTGQQVDVYVTAGPATATSAAAAGAETTTAGPAGTGPATGPAGTETAGDTPAGATRLVLAGVPVRLRPAEAGLSARSAGVVLSVSETDAAALVSALQEGAIDLVRVPRASELPLLSTPAPVAR